MRAMSCASGIEFTNAFPRGDLPPMVSYAQNFEDVMLRRALLDIKRGTYVDIGAYDPVDHSVTKWFYDCGWRGVNVEPNPQFLQRLERERKGDVNLGCAIGATSGTTTLQLIGDTGLSTISEPAVQLIASHGHTVTAAIEVPMMSLDELLDQCTPEQTIDFLKIDAEGSEYAIISAAALDRHRPRIIVVEATDPLTPEPSWEAWEPHLLARHYHFAWFDGLNRFYVREEDKDRLAAFAAPPCVFDQFQPYALASTSRVTAELTRRLAELEANYNELSAHCEALLNAVSASAEIAEDLHPDSAETPPPNAEPTPPPATEAAAALKAAPTNPAARGLVASLRAFFAGRRCRNQSINERTPEENKGD